VPMDRHPLELFEANTLNALTRAFITRLRPLSTKKWPVMG
jgi:hypothetical protein